MGNATGKEEENILEDLEEEDSISTGDVRIEDQSDDESDSG